MNASESSSTRPYLVRALYEWCTDNGLTPYVAVSVDDTVQVPREYVKNGEIVLNISFDATSALKLGNEFLEFKARFAGTAREIIVPMDHVIAIYARENGQGMAFPAPTPGGSASSAKATQGPAATTAATALDRMQASAPDDQRIMQLVSSDTSAESEASSHRETTDDEPPKPSFPGSSGSGSRPSLKRIK